MQVEIVLNLPYGDGDNKDANNNFYLYVHDKGQMTFPKNDLIFGSAYVFKTLKQENNFFQAFPYTRTRWKTLDTPNKRCDEDRRTEAKTTMCITRSIDKLIGCSMGLSGSDPAAKR